MEGIIQSDITKLVHSMALKSVLVIQNSNKEWNVIIETKGKSFPLKTQKGENRRFRTLDAAVSMLNSVEVSGFFVAMKEG